jgi:L-threonylcarbamoyladenylate synthase
MQATVLSQGPALSHHALKTKIVKCVKGKLKTADLAVVVDALRKGGLVVFPTDTVYGIGCSAFHRHAIESIYKLKGRSYSKPLPILLSEQNQLSLVAQDVLPEAEQLAGMYWPGALTLVVKTGPLALNATGGRATIAVRVPAHGVVRQVLDEVRLPLASTSANMSGDKAMHTFSQVRKAFDGRVDVIVDGGHCKIGEPSTVVDATHFPFTVLRAGAVPRKELMQRLRLG